MGSKDSPTPHWSVPRRIGFRFLFIYFLLFCIPGPYAELPLFEDAGKWFAGYEDVAVKWVAKSVLGITYDLGQTNGSGDRSYNYVLAFSHACIAGIVALIWSIIDWRRPSYPRLEECLRILLRYTLALIMLSYGLAKVLPPRQFSPPDAATLMKTYGESSPMNLLWTFMGFSVPYTIFAGAAETLAGLLLFFRRTTTLGALVSVGVMSNVVMLNFCYDVPVKLYSTHIVVAALYLLLPDLGRLANVLVLNRPTQPAPLALNIRRRGVRVTLVILKLLLLAFLVEEHYRGRQQLMALYGNRESGLLAGVYEPEWFRRAGADLPPTLGDARRWRSLSIYRQFLLIRTLDGQRQGYPYHLDPQANELRLTTARTPDAPPNIWKYQQREPGVLEIEGKDAAGEFAVRLKKVDAESFLLMNRGFRWVNEMPFNR